MKLKVFVIHDIKAEAYLQPFFMRSKGEALRAFEQNVQDPATTFSRFPTDFNLFEIGEYDDASAKLIPHSAPQHCGCAIEFVKQPSSPMPLFNKAASQ